MTKTNEVGKAMGPLTEGLTRVEHQFHLPAITPEFEILMHLYEKGPTPSAALRAASRASSAAFSLVLKRLVGGELLQVAHGCADRRVRKYYLTLWARVVMDEFARTTVHVLIKEPAAGE